MGIFSTPPVHLLKIRIRATFDPHGFSKKHFCKKVENLTLTPNTDFQYVHGECQKSAQKLPKHLKIKFDERFALRGAQYGPQLADKKNRGFLMIPY